MFKTAHKHVQDSTQTCSRQHTNMFRTTHKHVQGLQQINMFRIAHKKVQGLRHTNMFRTTHKHVQNSTQVTFSAYQRKLDPSLTCAIVSNKGVCLLLLVRLGSARPRDSSVSATWRCPLRQARCRAANPSS